MIAVVIRVARDADIPALRALERAANAQFADLGMDAVAGFEPTSAGLLAEFIQAGRAWVAADAADRPVAAILLSVVDRDAHVEQVAVDPTHAHQRLGKALLEVAADWARAQHLAALTLTTFAQVPWNAPYYTRLGFVTLAPEDLSATQRAMSAANAAGPLGRWPRVTMRRAV